MAEVPGSDLAIDTRCATITAVPTPSPKLPPSTPISRTASPTQKSMPRNLSDIANAVEPFRRQLPVFTGEVGDTWIYGVASDPLKVARYREV